MTTKKLFLKFKTTTGKEKNLIIAQPIETPTKALCDASGALVVSSNMFLTKEGEFASYLGAYTVQTIKTPLV
jgi:hypothetical protein